MRLGSLRVFCVVVLYSDRGLQRLNKKSWFAGKVGLATQPFGLKEVIVGSTGLDQFDPPLGITGCWVHNIAMAVSS